MCKVTLCEGLFLFQSLMAWIGIDQHLYAAAFQYFIFTFFTAKLETEGKGFFWQKSQKYLSYKNLAQGCLGSINNY